MLYRSSFLVLLLLLCHAVLAQQAAITGIVKDANTDEPLIGAVVRAGDNGAVTDVDGRFSLIWAGGGNCRLVISYVGYRQKEINCNGRNRFTIKLESDFISLKDVEVTAKKFDIDSFLQRTQKTAKKNYVPSTKTLAATYHMSLSDGNDTLLSAHMPVYLWGNKRKPFSYTVYRDREKSMKIGHARFNRSIIDNYVYNVMGILSGSFDKFMEKFLQTDEMDMISSTFYVDSEKYYDVVYISRDSRRISSDLLHGAKINADTAASKRYIWLHEFYINAQTTTVTFYQQIMVEATEKSYAEFQQLKLRNRIEDWLSKAKEANARYTNYKVVFQKDEEQWWLKREMYTDRFWHPFYKGKLKKDYVYHFEYDVQQLTKETPAQYEAFDPDVALRKYLAD